MKLSMTGRFNILLVPLVALGVVLGFIVQNAIADSTERIRRAYRVAELAQESRLHVSEMSDALKGYLLDPTNKSEAERKLAADDANVKAIETMKGLVSDSEILKLIGALGDFDETKLNPAENAAMDFVKAGDVAGAQDYYTKSYLPLRALYDELSLALLKAAENQSSVEIAAVSAESTNAVRLIISCLAVGILGFALALYLVTRKVSTRLRSLTAIIADTGVNVSVASGDLAGASQDVSSGTSRASAALSQTVASVEELSSMVKLNAANAREVLGLSRESREAAELGESEIGRLNTAVAAIAQSSRKIEDIINLIDDIAFQTNLLALNAAVEAARAGDHGKGFAVVADAVRNLAQRSAAAAKDITGHIKENVQRIDHGSKIADASGAVLKGIVSSAKKVAELNDQIAAASQEQANGLEQISKAMNELGTATGRNASVAERTASAATTMSDESVTLQETVGSLRELVEGGARAAPTAATERAQQEPAVEPVKRARTKRAA